MSEPLTMDQISAGAAKASTDFVLVHIERRIRALRCDVSAVAPEHVTGYEAGYKAAKRAALECLED